MHVRIDTFLSSGSSPSGFIASAMPSRSNDLFFAEGFTDRAQVGELHLRIFPRDYQPLSTAAKCSLRHFLGHWGSAATKFRIHVGDIHVDARPDFSLGPFYASN